VCREWEPPKEKWKEKHKNIKGGKLGFQGEFRTVEKEVDVIRGRIICFAALWSQEVGIGVDWGKIGGIMKEQGEQHGRRMIDSKRQVTIWRGNHDKN